jgi:hypothetical protein
MKRRVNLLVMLLLMTGVAVAQINPKLETELKKSLMGKEFAVLMFDSIPALSEKGLTKSLTIVVENGGNWKPDLTLGMKSEPTAVLPKNEILQIRNVEYGKMGLNIQVRTYEQIKYEKKGKEAHAHLRTLIRFHFDTGYINTFSEENLQYILSAVGNYLKFFETRDQAKSFVESR